jgi:hypothetical protein
MNCPNCNREIPLIDGEDGNQRAFCDCSGSNREVIRIIPPVPAQTPEPAPKGDKKK